MQKTPRPRKYASRVRLMVMRPLMRYSLSRDAFVLRVIGNDHGPVIRPERRRRGGSAEYFGPERRGPRAGTFQMAGPRQLYH